MNPIAQGLAAEALALAPGFDRVLVGGLGHGFTVRELLASQRVAAIEVVEIEGDVVDSLSDGTIAHGPALLADPRLNVLVDDVAKVLARAADDTYDLILLDIDDGPGYPVHAANAVLHGELFIECCRDILRSGGALAIWTASPAPELYGTLEDVFGNAELRPYSVRLGDRDEQYLLYVARKA